MVAPSPSLAGDMAPTTIVKGNKSRTSTSTTFALKCLIPFLTILLVLQHVRFSLVAPCPIITKDAADDSSPPLRQLESKIQQQDDKNVAPPAAMISSHQEQQSSSSSTVPPWLTLEAGPGQYVLREPWLSKRLGMAADHWKAVNAVMIGKLCSSTKKGRKKCNQQVQVQKSLGGGMGSSSWFSATSPTTGAIFARVNERQVQLTSDVYTVPVSNYDTFDVIVPLQQKERIDKTHDFLYHFALAATPVAQQFNIKFRLILSKFPSDEQHFTEDFLNDLKSVSGDIVEIVVVPCQPKKVGSFNRAACVNCLFEHTCQTSTCAVALMDIDLVVTYPFVINALAYIHPATTVYFPIFFSEYNPHVVELVEQTRKKEKPVKMLLNLLEEDYKGLWREHSTGMWVMTGSDAASVKMDESFEGWGGEDKAFYETVIVDKFNVVRVRDSGLLHPFHSKNCKVGSFVEASQADHCYKSLLKQEGSTLGILLQQQEKRQLGAPTEEKKKK